jgi:hypothetical protein
VAVELERVPKHGGAAASLLTPRRPEDGSVEATDAA